MVVTNGVGGSRTQVRSLLERDDVRRVLNLVALAFGFYFVQQLLWPAPAGVIVQGMVIGGLTALISFGIALIYRSNRVINFAQGDLGSAPAALAVLLIVAPGWPYWLALPAGIVAAVVLGGIVEFAIIRRFFRAPRLILTVATLFLAQLLSPLSVVLPQFFDITTPPQSFPSPFDFQFSIHPIIFKGNDVVAMLMVPVVILALAAFFRYTNIGIAVRASAESADRAALLGVPVKRIQTIVWIIAAVLSTTAIFLRAGIVGLPIGRVLGPAILIRALAACVIGRMERLPTIFFAAMGLGVIEQAIVWDTGRSILIAPILFVVILGALLVQRRGIIARADEMSTWQSTREVRPIPRELASLPEIKYGLKGLGAALAVVLLVLPLFIPESRVNLVAVVLIYAIVGVSLVVLTGWAGQVSLGQIAFMGLGAAVAGAITTRAGWDLAIALVVAGLVGALAAVIIGLPALRMKGLFLAITTLAFSQATVSYLLGREFFGWWLPSGRIPRPPLLGAIAVNTETRFYYLVLASLALALGMARGVYNSRTGRVLVGVRDNERASQAFGVNATAAKLTAFALSGFLAAFAGGLFVHHQQSLGLDAFQPTQSLSMFSMVVIGGMGSLPGAVIGAVYVRGFNYFLPPVMSMLTSGAGGLLVLMVLPGGLGSVVYQVRDGILRWIAGRRRILVTSLVADARDIDAVVDVRQKGLDFLREVADQMDAGRRAPASAAPPPEPDDETLDDALEGVR